jgi:hypothetical protein
MMIPFAITKSWPSLIFNATLLLVSIKDLEKIDGVSVFIDVKHDAVGEPLQIGLQRMFLYRTAKTVGRSANPVTV